MAQRRMFSLDIVDTDLFLDMPASTQNLYFHLGMRADDDGFVSSPKKITKLVNCSDDDAKLLIAKGLVIPFDSGVCVIRDWRINNYIKNDRYHETKYLAERATLEVTKSGSYLIMVKDHIQNVSNMEPKCIPDGSNTDTQDRVSLDKASIIKDSIKESKDSSSARKACPLVIIFPLNDKSEYPITLNQVDEWKELYPAVDVLQQLRNMRGWLNSNPARRKTRKGILRFINSWLSREQDKGQAWPPSQPLKDKLVGESRVSYTREV